MKSLDILQNEMAEAPLTEAQRKIWDDICAELAMSRMRVAELEKRLKVLERQPEEAEVSATLLNRPDFNREVARMLAFDERYGGVSSVIYLNLENMETLKEHYGEAMVNDAVRFISDALMNKVRQSDILGRLARDEFGVLLPHCSNENAWKKAEELATQLYDALVKVWKGSVRPELSFGAYTFNEKEELEKGLRNAASHLTKLLRKDT